MTLAMGRRTLAMPGPTNVPDEVLQAMHRPAIDIYEGEMAQIYERVIAMLRQVLRSESAHIYIYTANGHGAWDAAIANTLSPGDLVLALNTGHFAAEWAETAAFRGCRTELTRPARGGGLDIEAVAQRIAQDKGHEIKAVMLAQIDTASSAWADVRAVGELLRKEGHPALFMVDAVASLGCAPFEFDAWGVDVAVSASQKGLMSPPGLSFVAASQRARAALEHVGLRERYWDWAFREGPIFYQKFCGTAPEHHMFALERALGMLLHEEGLQAAWKRHEILAGAVRAAVEVWAQEGGVSFHIANAAARSNTVTTLRTKRGLSTNELRAFTSEVCGVTLGFGLGPIADSSFRIAHMGHMNASGMLGAIGSAEMGFAALGWPYGRGGVEAATRYMAEAVRRNA